MDVHTLKQMVFEAKLDSVRTIVSIHRAKTWDYWTAIYDMDDEDVVMAQNTVRYASKTIGHHAQEAWMGERYSVFPHDAPSYPNPHEWGTRFVNPIIFDECFGKSHICYNDLERDHWVLFELIGRGDGGDQVFSSSLHRIHKGPASTHMAEFDRIWELASDKWYTVEPSKRGWWLDWCRHYMSEQWMMHQLEQSRESARKSKLRSIRRKAITINPKAMIATAEAMKGLICK